MSNTSVRESESVGDIRHRQDINLISQLLQSLVDDDEDLADTVESLVARANRQLHIPLAEPLTVWDVDVESLYAVRVKARDRDEALDIVRDALDSDPRIEVSS